MTKNNYDTPQTKYTSLSEIRERKQALLDNIRNDDSQMKALWDQLFGTSPSSLTTNLPSKRFSGLLNTGAGVFDGIVLGWKLYRKFKRGDKLSLHFAKKDNFDRRLSFFYPPLMLISYNRNTERMPKIPLVQSRYAP
ncbi:hypothetical protein ABVC70_00640 [Hoylesella timonensis]|uniref:hypothetical protein n=1 Tax=Hoylesella timonensis TaxID=386414 RepID=UPI003369E88A